jgi:hypothetical protein
MATARRRYDTVVLQDFTGGLNLRPDYLNLEDNETPDCLNVEFGTAGGIRSRRGVVPVSAGAPMGAVPTRFGQFHGPGVAQILALEGTTVSYSTGSTFTSTTHTTASSPRFVQFLTRTYFLDGSATTVRAWDGTSIANMGTAWSPDLAAPTTNNVPQAKYGESHGGYMWVAHTYESAAFQRNRIRWSHPNKGDAWRAEDFIDVDPSDGDEIVGVASMGDVLLVFKNKSVHVVSGYDPDTFAVNRLSASVGAASQEAICVNEGICYWFDWNEGVFSYDGREVSNNFAKLRRILSDGTVTRQSGVVSLGYFDGRLWLGLQLTYVAALFAPAYTQFVYDMRVGAWSRNDLQQTAFLQWRRNTAPTLGIIAVSTRQNAYQLDKSAQYQDDFGLGNTYQFPSYWTSSWLDAGNPAAKKRWRAPRILGRSVATTAVTLTLWQDWDETVTKKTQAYTVTGTGWPSVQQSWDGTAVKFDFDRLSSLGTCRAVRVRLSRTGTVTGWQVDSITIPVIAKPLR